MGYAAHPKTGQSLPGFQTSVSWTGDSGTLVSCIRMEAESFLDALKMNTTPQVYMQGVLLQELIFFVIQQMSLCPLIHLLSPPASLAQELLSCLPESAHGAR